MLPSGIAALAALTVSLPASLPPLPGPLPEGLGWALVAVLVGWTFGSLSLGSRLIRVASGHDPRTVNPHRIGVENALRIVGGPLALASFALDLLKGALTVLLFGGSAWAALGVVAGHLFPPRLRFGAGDARGNGVLFGALGALVVAGTLPAGAGALPIVIFAAVAAAGRYVAPATAAAALALPLAAVAGAAGATLPLALLAALLVARQLPAFGRILDRTEPRLGAPPAVHGLEPGVVVAGFMIHPITVDDLGQARSTVWLRTLQRRGLLPDRLLRRLLLHARPFLVGTIGGIRLEDGRELRVLLVGGPMLPDQIRAHPEVATAMAVRGARLANEFGAEVFGLGAFWSTVGEKGLAVQREVPEIPVTNGGAYTAATVRAAIPGLLARFAEAGGDPAAATAAVVGANGVVAFGVARMVAPEVGALLLVGRDAERLERSADTLRRRHERLEVRTSVDPADVAGADLVFSATSHPDPVLFPPHVKPGAWIFDLGRPADVDASVREVPGVHLIPGGVVRPPGSMRSGLDLRFGDGHVPACLAETMIMAATRRFEHASLGGRTRSEAIAFYLEQGERLGFEIVTRDERVMQPADPSAEVSR